MSGISRREAIVGVSGVIALIGVGGAAAITNKETLLRPPGGQDEARFIGDCLRCDRCRCICPQGCISIAALEEGIVNFRTPFMDFRKGAWDFCSKCIEVCSTGSLASFDETTERIGLAVVNTDECVAYRSTGCTVCSEVCPYDAITTTGNNNAPVVDASKCNGCGTCEYKCPSASLGSYDGSKYRGINVEWMEQPRES